MNFIIYHYINIVTTEAESVIKMKKQIWKIYVVIEVRHAAFINFSDLNFIKFRQQCQIINKVYVESKM
jgi:hypothetical protein